MRRWGLARIVAAQLLLLIGGQGRSLATPGLSLAAELGPEIDSNVHRVVASEGLAPQPAPLLRGSLDGTLRLLASRLSFTLGYGAGAKLFLRDVARPADELVQRATLRAGLTVAALTLSLAGNYYETFQRGAAEASLKASQRDLRTGGGLLRMAYRAESSGLGLAVEAGYQGFAFKPNDRLSFDGLLANMMLGWQGRANRGSGALGWAAELVYTVATRYFNGAKLLCTDPDTITCGYDPKDRARHDWDHLWRMQLSYLGQASATLSYTLERNASNSFGDSYWRHVIGLRFTTPVIANIFATVTGALQLSAFDQTLPYRPLNQTISLLLDEENRSRLTVYLSRALTERWALGLRYSLYVNESGGDDTQQHLPRFRRQTALLVLRFDYEKEP